MLQSALVVLAIASSATLLPNVAAFSPASGAAPAGAALLRTIPTPYHTTLSPGSGTWSRTVTALNRHGRSRTALQSAKILPIAYTSLSAALFVRATKAATNKADAAVLAATAALALFNLGPTDNVRLASAKRADKNTPPASSGKAKQLRQAAKTWRSVVRIKLIGQFVGLVWMAAGNSIMKGAATVMAANMTFFLCGAGRAMHNANGEPAPMPGSMANMILTIDTILTSSALVAASAPVESTKRAIFAGIYAAGVSIGALEGLANLVSFYLMKTSKAKAAE
jgi:hypothetical protein